MVMISLLFLLMSLADYVLWLWIFLGIFLLFLIYRRCKKLFLYVALNTHITHVRNMRKRKNIYNKVSFTLEFRESDVSPAKSANHLIWKWKNENEILKKKKKKKKNNNTFCPDKRSYP